MKKLTKSERLLLSSLVVGEESEVTMNPFSKEEVELAPIGVALYDYINGCYLLGHFKSYDEARYLFAKLYPEAYMKLID
jgi:hypothetical protein